MVYLSGENFIKYKKLRDSNHVLLFMESPQRTKAAHVTHPSSSTKPAALRELLATRWHYKKAKKKKKSKPLFEDNVQWQTSHTVTSSWQEPTCPCRFGGISSCPILPSQDFLRPSKELDFCLLQTHPLETFRRCKISPSIQRKIFSSPQGTGKEI